MPPPLTGSDVSAWSPERGRVRLVQGAALWSRRGRHLLVDGRCEALSGVDGTDGNVIFCFSGDREALRGTSAAIRGSSVATVALLGGDALGWAQILVDDDLCCVGAAAVMRLAPDRLESGWRDPDVRRLRAGDLPEARSVVASAYAAGSPMSQIALPGDVVSMPAGGAWGLIVDGALVSVVTISVVDDSATVWSMSTPASMQRRGFGRRLLRAVLSEVADAGAAEVLLYASPMGEPLYRTLGFVVVEHWQAWSRPRWVPGRT